MILTGNRISEEVTNKNIIIELFSLKRITTNSYDISLCDTLIRYKSEILDPKNEPKYEKIIIDKSGYKLNKGDFVLGASVERIGSCTYVPLLHAKSGVARMGLFVHVTADLIDIGSIGNITFQMFATLPVKVYPNQIIAQMTFWETLGKIELYEGKYQNSVGPQVSKIYLDFDKH